MERQALNLQFYRYALTLTQTFIWAGVCFTQLGGSTRKKRKIFLSQCSIYLVADLKLRQRIHFRDIARITLSSQSAQIAFTPAKDSLLKPLLIDSLEARQIIKQTILQFISTVPVTVQSEPDLRNFIFQPRQRKPVSSKCILNLLKLKKQYSQREEVKMSPQIYLEQLIEETPLFRLCIGKDINKVAYVVKIYNKKKVIEAGLEREVLSERKNLEQVLSPYVPCLVSAVSTQSKLIIICEEYRGYTLRKFLQKRPLEKQHYPYLFAQITTAIGHLREAHLTYNLSLDNIFVTEKGLILLNQLSDCGCLQIKGMPSALRNGLQGNKDNSNDSIKGSKEESQSDNKSGKAKAFGGWQQQLGRVFYEVREHRPLVFPVPPIKDVLFAKLLHGLLEEGLGLKNDYHEILKHQYFARIDKTLLSQRNCAVCRSFQVYYPKCKEQMEREPIQIDHVLFKDYQYCRDGQIS